MFQFKGLKFFFFILLCKNIQWLHLLTETRQPVFIWKLIKTTGCCLHPLYTVYKIHRKTILGVWLVVFCAQSCGDVCRLSTVWSQRYETTLSRWKPLGMRNKKPSICFDIHLGPHLSPCMLKLEFILYVYSLVQKLFPSLHLTNTETIQLRNQ